MQTVAGIVSPAEKSCVVGLKPTRGLTPSDGIIPVSYNQDTVGLITRNVQDAAEILYLVTNQQEASADFATFRRHQSLQGLRIGVLRDPSEPVPEPKAQAFQEALDILRALGAKVVPSVELTSAQEYLDLPQNLKDIVLETDFKVSMNSYLQCLSTNPRNITNLETLIEAIKNDLAEEYPARDVAVMEAANNTSVHSEDYQLMLAKNEYFTHYGGLEDALQCHGCDVLLSPLNSLLFQTFAAIGGHPAMAVPMGFFPEGTEVSRDSSGLVETAPGIP
jgi:amidase